MHGSTLWPGIFTGLGEHHRVMPMCSHHRAATCAGQGTGKGGDGGPPLAPADQATSNYGNRLFSVYSEEKKGVEIHWPDELRPLHRCPRLLSNSDPRRKMEMLEVPYAPYLILLHITECWMFASGAKGPELASPSNPTSILPDRRGTVCNAKSWTCLCLFFFFPPPSL